MSLLAFDTETWLIRNGRAVPRMVVGSFYDGETADLLTPDETVQRVADHLASGGEIVGHQIDFDMCVLLEHAGAPLWLLRLVFTAYEEGRIKDTKIRDMLLSLSVGIMDYDPAIGRPPRFSLSECLYRALGEKLEGKSGDDIWRLRYSELDGVSFEEWPEEAREYALNDAIATMRLYEAQGAPVPNEAEQTYHAFTLNLAAAWGMRTNRERIDALEDKLSAEVREVEQRLIEAGIFSKRGRRSNKTLQRLITEAYDGRPPLTDTGMRKLESGEAKLSDLIPKYASISGMNCAWSGDPVLRDYGLTARSRYHLNNTIPKLREGQRYPITPRYRVPLATGRASCANPNMQNWPRFGGYRECAEPREGFVFIACDYSQLELCTFAQTLYDLLGDSTLRNAINDGYDCHLILTAEMVNLNYDQVSKQTHKLEREFAKVGNYGYPGGMGARTMLSTIKKRVFKGELDRVFLDYGIDECEHLRDVWMRAWPEVEEYFSFISRLVEEGGSVRLSRSGRVRGGASFCQACNTFFQGPAADGALSALTEVSRRCYSEPASALYGSRVIAFVHDELLLESPVDRAPEAGEELQGVMINRMQRFTPDVKIKADPVLMTRWTKAAETTYDEDGRLAVYV